ncbi:uncharacterized protein LOC143534980 [Bidens hawaiensis]|uniref:uncharacterized protein LOC143534980 n=1 Tax=Bidens hawaiensis TaxID=980011 RepID=UPI00404AEA5A
MANPTRRTSGSVLRSHSPTRTFYTSPNSNSSVLNNRSASPTRVNLYGSPPSPYLNRTITRNTQQSNNKQVPTNRSTRMCMCSPTTHPGSFRCNLHKNILASNNSHNTVLYPPNRLNARRSAMTNSLVRIGTVEGGDLVKRALSALIRPSSHQQRRRTAFQPRPSRLSVMSKADV